MARNPNKPRDGIFVFGRGPAGANLDGVEYRRLRSSPAPVFNSIQIQRALPRSVQAVLYQSFTPPVSAAARVTVIFDMIYLSRPELFTRIERLYFRTLPKMLGRAEVVATISEHVREELIEHYPGRDPATIRLIYPGVDQRFLMDVAARARAAESARHELGLDRPYVAAVGRRNPRKNLARLVRAFLAARLDGVELVLAGPTEGPRDEELEIALEQAGTQVRVLGEVSDEALPWIYAGARCVCYVSLAEGFGIPPLEAMASGTPVIASSIPPLLEVLGDSALFVNPLDEEEIAEALRRLVLGDEERSRLVRLGLEQADRFTWDRSADAALAALRMAAEIRPRSRSAAQPEH
jgi:glycosyltransferase involved in cell wall biosynthesis